MTAGNDPQRQPMFGVYDIIETVGQGGMGIVYRAHDTALDRVVALKVLKEDLRQSRQIAARFQREAEAIASLNHPSIVTIYSVGSVGRIPYIAMEFIQGAPLSAVMKRVKTLPWKRAMHIAEQVAEALACAHDAHIIHRDIKPGNILVGADDKAYVTDFGIAKVLTAETQLTVEGSRLGTPHYMSPERCSKGDITPSSDLYSLGIVLFQMLCGRLPYEANSPVDLIRKIVTEPPARLSDFLQDAPEDVERLVAFLIEKKPGNRPKSAAYTAELCRRVIDGDPLFDEDGVAASIRDYRDTLPTPSTATTTHIDSALGNARGAWEHIRALWSGIPAPAKLWVPGLLAIAAMAAAGQWTAKRSFSGYALGTVGRWDQSVDAWTASTAPADFVPESEGVTVVKLNFRRNAVARISPVGATDFVIELDNHSEKSGTIVALYPDASTARVGVPTSASTLRLLSGTKLAAGASELYYFARAAAAARGFTVNRVDATPNNTAYGKPVFATDDLRRTIAGNVLEIRQLAASPSGRELAIAVRGDAGNRNQVVRATLPDGPGRTEIAPLLLDVPEIASMMYSDTGDLFLAEKSSTSWTVVRVPAGGSSRQAETIFEAPTSKGEVIAVNPRGALLKARTGSSAASIEWRDFSPAATIQYGEAADAQVTNDAERVVLIAPDRRGNAQLWLAAHGKPTERKQLTFLSAGLGAGISVSNDGRYAVCTAPPADSPSVILVNLEKAGQN